MNDDPTTTDHLRRTTALWAEIVRVQIGRLEDAVDTLDRGTTVRRSEDWPSHDGEATEIATIGQGWITYGERYFVLAALAQLRKCVHALPDDGLPMVRDQKAIRLLRDIEEHWEQPEGVGRSLTERRRTHPEAGPGMLQWNNKHVWLGDFSTTEFLVWASEVDEAVRQRSAEAGKPIPKPDDPVF